MNKRLFSIFNLTEDQAIEILTTPPDQLEDPTDRYIAASQLINYPSDRSIDALVSAIQEPVSDLDSRIVRRKAVESLGYLKAEQVLPVLKACLQDEDHYTVQNAVWSIGEIGTQEESILSTITALLKQPEQNQRLMIQTLAKLGCGSAVEEIRALINVEDPATAGAAIAALYQLTGDAVAMPRVIAFLQHDSVNARRSCIQDLIDAQQYSAISDIARCSVSIAFRLRGVRLLAESGLPAQAITFAQLEPILDQVIRDHPEDLDLVHEYDQPPSLEFVLNELYETDFSRCYLATQTLIQMYQDVAPSVLMQEFNQKAKGDYGAHYHVLKLFGWFQYAPAYEVLVEALHNPAPQFQKSRTAAAIALGELGDRRAIPELQHYLNSPIWGLSYACLMALNLFRVPIQPTLNPESADFLVEAKRSQVLTGLGI